MAAKNDHAEAVKILLGLNADPFIRCSKKLSPEDVADDEALKAQLRKSKMFQITQNWSVKQKRQVQFTKEGINYLNRNTDEILKNEQQKSFQRRMDILKGDKHLDLLDVQSST